MGKSRISKVKKKDGEKSCCDASHFGVVWGPYGVENIKRLVYRIRSKLTEFQRSGEYPSVFHCEGRS